MIADNVHNILKELPQGTQLVAAAKGRSADEVKQAVDAGVKIIVENYVQQAEAVFNMIGNEVKWHFVGHLQKNKVKKAVRIFDMIETVDSVKLAEEINRQCEMRGKTMPVLIEINSGREQQKFGVSPENAEALIRELTKLKNISIMGLMTMAPFFKDAEKARAYFKRTKELFDSVKKLNLPGVDMKYLSMGMSATYKIAIEEGANIVRIGTEIFGEK